MNDLLVSETSTLRVDVFPKFRKIKCLLPFEPSLRQLVAVSLYLYEQTCPHYTLLCSVVGYISPSFPLPSPPPNPRDPDEYKHLYRYQHRANPDHSGCGSRSSCPACGAATAWSGWVDASIVARVHPGDAEPSVWVKAKNCSIDHRRWFVPWAGMLILYLDQ